MKKTGTPSSTDRDEIREYVTQNREFLSRVLRRGDDEARAYVLALLANGGTEDDIESVQEELDRMKGGKD
jgi:hypothetical protein